MDDTFARLHREKVREIADEYRAKGYTVITEPDPSELPDFLEGYRPDVVATSPEESVIVEVKVGATTPGSERFRALVEAVQKYPGWGFSLVIVDPGSDVAPSPTARLMDRDEVAARVHEGQATK